MDTDGTAEENISNNAYREFFSVGARGVKNELIFVSDRDGTFNLWKMNTSGQNLIQLTTEGGGQPYWWVSPNQSPVADAGPNITIACEEQYSTIVQGVATDSDEEDLIYRWLDGEIELSTWQAVDTGGEVYLDLSIVPYFNIGQHTLTLEVSDGKATTSDNMILTVDNSAPHAAPTGSGVYEIWSNINIGGQVSDFDGDTLNYEWLEGTESLFSGIQDTVAGGDPVSLTDHIISDLSLGKGCRMNAMKRLSQIIPKIIPLAIFVAIPAICFAGQFKVTRVTDGDTVKVTGNDVKMTIRLVGIDAPETSKKKNQPGQPFSRKSTKYLASLVLNKSVELKSYGTDRYGRTLGVIFVGGKNMNLEMVKAGLAEVYRGKPADGLDLEPYWNAETEAKKAGIGMWSLGDKYISPKEWRRMHRK